MPACVATQLSQATFTGGSAPGADDLYVRAYDGSQWSNWHPIMATMHA
jgi:hypothetical protein